MIIINQGDILETPEDIIGHQVNCKGVFNAGLARQIRKKYPEAYAGYMNYCKLHDVKPKSGELLGSANMCFTNNDNKIIANLFGQYSYGKGQHTDYGALYSALKQLKDYALSRKKTVALPYGIGCGLAGGSLFRVYDIINEVFNDYEVVLYKFNK